MAQTGNLLGTVVDEKDVALSGVTVTLIGATTPQIQIIDAQGQPRINQPSSDGKISWDISIPVNAATEDIGFQIEVER